MCACVHASARSLCVCACTVVVCRIPRAAAAASAASAAAGGQAVSAFAPAWATNWCNLFVCTKFISYLLLQIGAARPAGRVVKQNSLGGSEYIAFARTPVRPTV